MQQRFVIPLALGAVLAGLPAFADKPTREQRAVEYRQAILTVVGHNMGPLAGMARGEIPYDGEVFRTNTQRIAWMATMIPDAFALDTSETGYTTEARARIWDDLTRFENYAYDLQEQAERVAAVAEDGGLDAVRPVFGDMAQACKTCHDRFRGD